MQEIIEEKLELEIHLDNLENEKHLIIVKEIVPMSMAHEIFSIKINSYFVVKAVILRMDPPLVSIEEQERAEENQGPVRPER